MNKVCLVTGGTRGIGAAISLALKQQGYTVIANYHTNQKTAEVFSKKHNIPVYSWDVSAAQSCEESMAEIAKIHGNIDILIHNAGVTHDVFFHKMSHHDWNQVISTNLTSCFNVTRPIIDAMRQSGFGRIVFISSINALKGQLGQTNYCASKAGVIGFAKALALENARCGITVNVVAPGYTRTDMVRRISPEILDQIITQIPVGRLGEADEIAHCVSFLINDKSGFITGETIHINGGQLMH
jgi:acetoacetyl-CoA reductase